MLSDWAKAETKPAYNYSEIEDTPDLSGYANVQADWNEADEESDAYIKNKPTKVSDFENDAEYVTKAEYDELLDKYNELKSNSESISRESTLKENASDFKELLSSLCDEQPVNVSYGAILSTFSISPNKKVVFSQGNLQYRRGGTHSTMDEDNVPGTWRFAEHQYDLVGGTCLGIHPDGKTNVAGVCGNVYYNNEKCDNLEAVINENYEGWFDMFGYGTSGWNSGANVFMPGQFSANDLDYIQEFRHFTSFKKADWGYYNTIQTSSLSYPCTWRVLSDKEWLYLLQKRPNAAALFGAGMIHLDEATPDGVSDVYGIILLPDNWSACPDGCTFNNTATPTETGYTFSDFSINEYSETQWASMQSYGAIFLPCGGTLRFDAKYSDRDDKLCYSHAVYPSIYGTYFTSNDNGYMRIDNTSLKVWTHFGDWAMLVRLVADVE